MRSSILSLLAVPAFLFTTAFAAPTKESALALEPRQASEAYTIVSDLYTQIQQYTGAINETAAGLTSSSTKHDNHTAAVSFRQNIKHITAAVKAAKKQADKLEPDSGILKARQTDTALAQLVTELLLEISGALNNIIATLGLTSLLGSLNPLVSSLSALLLSLKNVVDNLLILVKQIVDGLLVGLSLGLAGLIL